MKKVVPIISGAPKIFGLTFQGWSINAFLFAINISIPSLRLQLVIAQVIFIMAWVNFFSKLESNIVMVFVAHSRIGRVVMGFAYRLKPYTLEQRKHSL
jgi:hypothetical protein